MDAAAGGPLLRYDGQPYSMNQRPRAPLLAAGALHSKLLAASHVQAGMP